MPVGFVLPPSPSIIDVLYRPVDPEWSADEALQILILLSLSSIVYHYKLLEE